MEKPNFLTVDACPQLTYDFAVSLIQFYFVLFIAAFLGAWLFFLYFTKYVDQSLERHPKNGANHD